MQHPGWILVLLGILIAGIGLLWLAAPFVPWVGKLPGDTIVERENFRLYIPLMTCLLLSLLLTGIGLLVRYFSR
jgi:hypothetical protein